MARDRQAASARFLRIYQSPQTLDGSLIHPDDYHLAQRLIDNTDLAAPPPAPEGWLPPKIKVPKPPKQSAGAATVATEGAPQPAADASTAPAADTAADATQTATVAEAPPEAAQSPRRPLPRQNRLAAQPPNRSPLTFLLLKELRLRGLAKPQPMARAAKMRLPRRTSLPRPVSLLNTRKML